MNLRSARATVVIGGISLGLVALLGWFLLIGPTVGNLGEVGDRKTEAEDRSSMMAIQLAQLRSQADGLPDTNREADRLAQVFPPTADQPGFFAQVNQAAKDAGIPVDDIIDINHEAPVVPDVETDTATNLTVPEELTGSKVALQVVTIAVRGRYDRLSRVLANLESMRRTVLVTAVDVSLDDEGDGPAVGRQMLRLTVTGVTFVAEPLDPPKVDGAPSSEAGSDDDDTEQASG
jgi:Tfp pilus assembly protein PilO